jgi:hypothetical protein
MTDMWIGQIPRTKPLTFDGFYDDAEAPDQFSVIESVAEPRRVELVLHCFQLLGVSFYAKKTVFYAEVSGFNRETQTVSLRPVSAAKDVPAEWWRRAGFWAGWPIVRAWEWARAKTTKETTR